MLNPNWKKIYNEKDFSTLHEIDSMGNTFMPEQMKLMNLLLDKYYRNKSNSFLGNDFSSYQKKIILKKTMDSLAEAVYADSIKEKENWNNRQMRDESEETKYQRKNDLAASFKLSKRNLT